MYTCGCRFGSVRGCRDVRVGACERACVCACPAGGMLMFVAWLQPKRETNNEVNGSELQSGLQH